MARPCAWSTCRNPVADDLLERVALVARVAHRLPQVKADLVVKADLARKALAVPAVLVCPAVLAQRQVLLLQPPRQRVAPARANLWPCPAPTLA